jgi:hypothetical protein
LHVTLVDRQDIVSPETRRGFEALGTQVAVARHDVFDWLERVPARSDAIVANLFLHHFEDEPLARLLSLAARKAPLFVACEPRRSAFALAGARLLGAIGCNDVTRHDAAVSVRAGFRGDELSRLWPAGEWALREEKRGGFSHLFSARHDRRMILDALIVGGGTFGVHGRGAACATRPRRHHRRESRISAAKGLRRIHFRHHMADSRRAGCGRAAGAARRTARGARRFLRARGRHRRADAGTLAAASVGEGHRPRDPRRRVAGESRA